MQSLKIENLTKTYRLGSFGSGTLSDDLKSFLERRFARKGFDSKMSNYASKSSIKAIDNITFKAESGDVIGVVGKNGAGKSTLLKLLSGITLPTSGEIKIKGKMSSLLEVGTGFHPELTGRENIFLNGAILGMRRTEILQQFDSIVDFSGCSVFIDTPIKRYSSGMLVRLGFSVAAHLNSDILIVDEVLAVGDLEFQNKCLGKMGEVGRSGKTILFVSHNMQAVSKLCNRGILLSNGKLVSDGYIESVVNTYIKDSTYHNQMYFRAGSDENLEAFVMSAEFIDVRGEVKGVFLAGEEWRIRIKTRANKNIKHFVVGLGIKGGFDELINTTWTNAMDLSEGEHVYEFSSSDWIFSSGIYYFTIGVSSYERTMEQLVDVLSVVISDVPYSALDPRIIRIRGNGILLNQLNYNYSKLS